MSQITITQTQPSKKYLRQIKKCSLYNRKQKFCGKCEEPKPNKLFRCNVCNQKLRTKPRSKKKVIEN